MPADHPTDLPPFKSIRYAGAAPGPRLIVTAAVHGNETCGTRAIERLVQAIDSGALRIAAGVLTLVPITNPLAYRLGRRAGDRNLNRALAPTATPRQFEDHVANWLCPLLAAHDVLLDLHSFQAQGQPFVMVGPDDNTGTLEPFAHAAEEEALVRRLGVNRAVDGWLSTYAEGVQRRRADAGAAAAGLDLDPRYGIGTTEYMRSQGGWALTLECGQHDDPAAPEVAWRAIRNTLAHLRLVDEPAPPAAHGMEALRLFEVVDKRHPDDRFSRAWQSFDALQAGDIIGTRRDGEVVRAPCEGRIVFPNAAADARQEWFYLAKPTSRFG
ncbi:succinylglutamate desuccinylase/aspartoacylase domain-containing protein [Ideonella sp. BN130291]|uniref:succinylglutamate desuccinylase/aspartoacylase domain-containing protein n=1 Tax=Ideonella sp. BN130291 TaxID=3112940 RepID=UPI002E272E9B|nr:succinylglutamate desuccinylase/aspartoacylase family protein [Ideonella sp. BN130291]